jgi:hypothetical protein
MNKLLERRFGFGARCNAALNSRILYLLGNSAASQAQMQAMVNEQILVSER